MFMQIKYISLPVLKILFLAEGYQVSLLVSLISWSNYPDVCILVTRKLGCKYHQISVHHNNRKHSSFLYVCQYPELCIKYTEL